MTRETAAVALRHAVVKALTAFLEENPDETPYAFALLGGQALEDLGYAIATEEGLDRLAAGYELRLDADASDDVNPEGDAEADEAKAEAGEMLKDWLRWANPDDGWYQEDFDEASGVAEALTELNGAGELGDEGDRVEEFCVEALAGLGTMPEWSAAVGDRNVVVGFTWGEDPRDFLRSATRANPYEAVLTLWSEYAAAEEADALLEPNDEGDDE